MTIKKLKNKIAKILRKEGFRFNFTVKAATEIVRGGFVEEGKNPDVESVMSALLSAISSGVIDASGISVRASYTPYDESYSEYMIVPGVSMLFLDTPKGNTYEFCREY